MCAKEKLNPTHDIRCGTYNGYQAHRARGENFCEPCREANKVHCAEYAKRHPDRKKKKDARYREANKEKRREYARKYFAENPNKQKVRSRRYRASKASAKNEFFNIQMVLDKYGSDCHICSLPINLKTSRVVGSEGWEKSLHLDHLIPISKGGPHSLENIRPAHGICNMKKGANT